MAAQQLGAALGDALHITQPQLTHLQQPTEGGTEGLQGGADGRRQAAALRPALMAPRCQQLAITITRLLTSLR